MSDPFSTPDPFATQRGPGQRPHPTDAQAGDAAAAAQSSSQDAADGDAIEPSHVMSSGGDAPELPRLQQPPRGRRLAKKADARPACPLTPEQRLLVLDAWNRNKLPAGDFAPLVGLSKHTLYAWKKKFETEGPAGLLDKPRGAPEGSRLPELTKRTILMLKQANPDWGV